MVIVTVHLQKERGMIIGNHPLEVNHCVEIVHISVEDDWMTEWRKYERLGGGGRVMREV